MTCETDESQVKSARKRQTISLRELVEKGIIEPVKRGRPCLYATEAERREAHKAQQRECVKRHAARVKEARRTLMESCAVAVH